MKPGWKSSELWVTVGSQAVAVLAIITLASAPALLGALAAIAAVAGSAYAAAAYAQGRTAQKLEVLVYYRQLQFLSAQAPPAAPAPQRPLAEGEDVSQLRRGNPC